MPKAAAEVADRFILKTRKLPNGCIVWAGGTIHGYGSFNIGRKTVSAHRISFALFVGEIPDGLCVLHDCPAGDNRACVNPLHLWLGTQAANMDDMKRKGRQARQRGEQHGMVKLSEGDARRIIERCGAGESQHAVAKELGMNQSSISRIVTGKRWHHLQGARK